jgi:hypothetical protein
MYDAGLLALILAKSEKLSASNRVLRRDPCDEIVVDPPL